MKVSLENDNHNVIKFPQKPAAVAETPVYDLNAARQLRQATRGDEQKPATKCTNGVCLLEWKPKTPAA